LCIFFLDCVGYCLTLVVYLSVWMRCALVLFLCFCEIFLMAILHWLLDAGETNKNIGDDDQWILWDLGFCEVFLSLGAVVCSVISGG